MRKRERSRGFALRERGREKKVVSIVRDDW